MFVPTPRTDIVDGRRKLILGLIWSLVLRFSIAEIKCVPLSRSRPSLPQRTY